MAIVKVWRNLYNADFSEALKDTKMLQYDLKIIVNEVREETRKKYIKE